MNRSAKHIKEVERRDFLPQPVLRGGLFGHPTPRPTALGPGPNLERLEKAGRSWGRSGGREEKD